ncbi:MAG: hypothetical protein KDI69_11285, partial [Xanthomonadales bacterium]|nr:hypothetical protein [Xanthomonadales bacterium]
LEASTAPAAQRPLFATGPGHTDKSEAFKVRVAWNDPTMAPGDRRWGQLLLGGSDANPTGTGRVLVKMRRAATVQHAASVLAPGMTRTMSLLPGHAQDRLYIEVPPNAKKLTVTSSGSGEVKIYLAHDSSPSSPTIAVAPARESAAASSANPGANDSISIATPTLKPGRWYITPVNRGSSRAEFTLGASLEYAGNRPQPGWGNWYNSSRSGWGIFLSPFDGGNVWTMAWYTFAEDGTPVWLGGTVPAPTAKQSSVSFDLMRASWNGQRLHAVTIGTATLTLVDSRTLWMSWNMDGESGSQLMQRIESSGCGVLAGTSTKPDGNWYQPAHSGYGFETLIFPGLETFISYIYDGQGTARWVGAYREANPAIGPTQSMQAKVANGSCPLCTYVTTTSKVAGTFSRSFNSGTQGHMALDVTFPAPMSGHWVSDDEVQLLTSPVTCP